MLLAFLIAVAWPPFLEPRLVEGFGAIDARPGAWAEYLVRTTGREDARVRVTCLAAEGEGRYWLELAMAAQSGIVSAARLLVHGGVPSSAIERMYLMLAGQQPIEIPLAARRSHVRTRRVPDGGPTRIRRAASVPLWGLVEARSRTQSIELLASGASGGHSVFPPGWTQGNGRESAK